MYPDTDSPPLSISRERVDSIKAQIPALPWIKEVEYKKLGLPEHLVWMLAVSPRRDLFDRLIAQNSVDPILTATVLLEQLKNFSRLGGNLANISDESLEELFNLYGKDVLAREGFRMLLEESALSGNTNWAELVEILGIGNFETDEIKDIITESIRLAKEELSKKSELISKVAIGFVMDKLRGSVPGRELVELLQGELLSQGSAC